MATTASFVPLSELIDSWSEPAVMPADGDGLLDKVGIEDFEIVEKTAGLTTKLALAFEDELGFELPGLDGFGLYLGSQGGTTTLQVEVDITAAGVGVSLQNVSVVLRLPPALLKPVSQASGKWEPILGPNGQPAPFELTLSGITVSFSSGGLTISFPQGAPALGLPPVMVADSGVVVEASDISLHFDPSAAPPAGQAAGFRGVFMASASVHLPPDLGVTGTLSMTNAAIGPGGFSGSVSYDDTAFDWDPTTEQYTGTFAGELFGFKGGLKKIDITFVQNALTKGSISAEALVPWLDKRIGLALSVSLNGDFGVALSAPPAPTQDPNAKMVGSLLELKEPSVLDAKLEALAFDRTGDEFAVSLSGSLRPLMGGVDWPEVGLKRLTISSDGRVDLGGGWIDVPEQKSASFNGFPLELRKVGFGSDVKTWFGISGGIKLIDGLPIGGSVDGLKLKWDPADPANTSKWEVELQGIAVQLRIPDVLDLDGSVAFFNQQGKQWFQGGCKVAILPINLLIDAQVMIGRTPDYSFFYIFLEVGLPTGIPLGQTGVAIYGMGGLFGYNVKPGRRVDEPWYQGWYKRPPVGPTAASKWTDQRDRLAFGATVTLGTYPDNGYTFNGRVLVILVIPGPLIMIEGKANLGKDRKELATKDPLIRLLAVIDGEAGTLLVDLEPHYIQPDPGGDVIDISGVAEAFFDFNHSDRWYINLGLKDPREKRIRAEIIKLFQANAYVMLNNKRVALGGYVGIEEKYSYGPVTVALGFWFEGDAELIFRPSQFKAQAGIHGRVDLKAFGFGLGLELDAQADVKTPTPFEFHALIHAKADLPWPLPDPEISVPYDYVEPAPPPVTVPLQSIEVSTLKASESWDVSTNSTTPLLVPLDGKPVLVFSKAMHDDAGVGGNIQPAPSETVGDLKLDYHLDSVTLERLEQGNWVTKATRPSATGADDVYGMWLPMVGGTSPPNSKLMLFSKTPFDGLKESISTAPAEEFAQKYPEYPCVVTCVDFEDAHPGPFPTDTYYKGLTLSYDFSTNPHRPHPEFHDPRGSTGGSHMFRWTQLQTLWIPDVTGPPTFSFSLPAPAHRVMLRLSIGADVTLTGYTGGQKQILNLPGGGTATYYTGGTALPPHSVKRKTGVEDYEVILDTDGIVRIEVDGAEIEVFEVCWIEKAEVPIGGAPPPGTTAHNAAEVQRAADEDFLLDPNSTYRLRVKTHVEVSPSLLPGGWNVELSSGPLGPTTSTEQSGKSQYDFEHIVYVKTEGPPGFLGPDIDRRVQATAPTAPAGAGTPSQPHSLVRTLRTYVAGTVPDDGANIFYRSYDVAVAFNESYVERMYDDYGRDLKIALADRNGNPPTERVNGTLLTAPPALDWIEADTDQGTRADDLWQAMLASANCDIQRPPKPRNDVLTASPVSPVMAPRMTYSATLEPDPATNASDNVLHSFSFTTSAFSTFAHQIHSFGGRLWLLDETLDGVLPALTNAQQTALNTAAQAGQFEAIEALFNLPRRDPPAELEVTLLNDSALRYGLLVESPEPLDARRVTGTMRASPATSTAASHTGPVRIRDAAIGDRSGSAYNDEWVELIVTESCEIPNLALEHRATSTGPVSWAALETITGAGRFEPGDLIRLHAGKEPSAGPPDDERVHTYVTPSTGTPDWMLHPSGDSLRLVDPSGIEVSRGDVVTGLAQLAVTSVWNQDRTRAFLLPTAFVTGTQPATLANGTYRIEWTFARNVTGGPVLRRGGKDAAEQAVTQFPVA